MISSAIVQAFAFVLLAAAPIKVHLYSASGFNALTPERVDEMFAMVADYWRAQKGIDLVVTKRRYIKNKFKQYHCISELCRFKLLQAWRKWAAKRNNNRKILKLIVLPPIVDGGSWYLAGYAASHCSLLVGDSVAYAAAQEYNAQGVPRFWHSAVGLAHEIGHLLGAAHSTGLMDTGVLWNTTEGVWPELDFKAAKSIKQCTGQ